MMLLFSLSVDHRSRPLFGTKHGALSCNVELRCCCQMSRYITLVKLHLYIPFASDRDFVDFLITSIMFAATLLHGRGTASSVVVYHSCSHRGCLSPPLFRSYVTKSCALPEPRLMCTAGLLSTYRC